MIFYLLISNWPCCLNLMIFQLCSSCSLLFQYHNDCSKEDFLWRLERHVKEVFEGWNRWMKMMIDLVAFSRKYLWIFCFEEASDNFNCATPTLKSTYKLFCCLSFFLVTLSNDWKFMSCSYIFGFRDFSYSSFFTRLFLAHFSLIFLCHTNTLRLIIINESFS